MNKWKDAEKRMIAAAMRGMEKAMLQLEADTKALTHVDSGDLRRSWTHDVNNNGSEIVGTVGSNLAYAKYEDAYHPNISEAIEKNKNKYFQTIAKELKNRW